MTIISARIWDPAVHGSIRTVELETADTVGETIGKIRQICTVAEQPAPIETQADRAKAEHGDTEGPADDHSGDGASDGDEPAAA